MKSQFILSAAFAALVIIPQAHALDLGVGSNTSVNAAGVSANVNTNNDASAGILARNDARVNTDARFHAGGRSSIDTDTSAGADENSSLRASIRNQDDIDFDATSPNAAANTNATGLFGISSSNRVRGSLND